LIQLLQFDHYVVVRYHGWLAGCQLTLDTSKTAAALLTQKLFTLGCVKDDLTFHWAMYVFLVETVEKNVRVRV